MVEYITVEKSGIKKQILKKDLPEYLALGWVEVKGIEISDSIKRFTKI